MNKHYKTLIVVDDPHLCDDVVKRFHGEDDCLLVAFSLEAKLALEDRGLVCHLPDELVELPDLDRMGEENLVKTRSLCAMLDRAFMHRFDVLKAQSPSFPTLAFFQIKVYLDAVSSAYLIMSKILREIKMDKIVVYQTMYPLEHDFIKGTAIVARCIQDFLPEAEIVWTQPRFSLHHSLKSLKFFGKQMRVWLYEQKQRKSGLDNAFILGHAHDVPETKKVLSGKFNFYSVDQMALLLDVLIQNFSNGKSFRPKKNDLDFENAVDEIFDSLSADRKYRSLLSWDGMDLSGYISDSIRDCIKSSVRLLFRYSNDIIHWIKRRKPRFLLTAACRLDFKNAFILALVKDSGIPVVTYQEGGGAGYLDWPLFNLDMDCSDYFLVYGEGVRRSPYIKGKATVEPVGSLRLERIKSFVSSRPNQPRRIYVILDNIKTNVYQHYPYNGGFFSQAYRHQQKILDVLGNIPGTYFYIKTVKGKERFYKKLVHTNCTITTTPLTELLSEADAFILEYPSTVLQECLLTDKPVALLNATSDLKFEESEAKEQLSKRVRICTNYDQYAETVKQLILEMDNPSPPKKDTRFFENYCTMDHCQEKLELFFSRTLTTKVIVSDVTEPLEEKFYAQR